MRVFSYTRLITLILCIVVLSMLLAAQPAAAQGSPDLVADKCSNPCGTVGLNVPFEWIILIDNIGDADAVFSDGDLVFVDELPTTNVTYGTATAENFGGGTTGSVSCNAIVGGLLECFASGTLTIPPNGFFDIVISVTATALGTLENPGSGDFICAVNPTEIVAESDYANNECFDSVTVTTLPDLVAVKTNDTGGFASMGETFNWIITITNSGVENATFGDGDPVFFDDLQPSGATYTMPPTVQNVSGVTTGSIDCSPSSGTFVGCGASGQLTIVPGGSFQIVIPVTVTIASGTLVNPDPTNVEAFCIVDPFRINEESNEENNLCTDTVTIGQVQPTAVPPPTILDPALSKSGSPASATVGETVTWTVVVSNPHAQTLTNVTVQDIIPAQFSITSVTQTQGTSFTNGQTITFDIGTLNPGQSVTLTIVTTAITAPANGTICNTANSGGSFAQTCMQVFPAALPPTGAGSPISAALRTWLPLIALIATLIASLLVLRRRTA